jgi:hypothetical protein
MEDYENNGNLSFSYKYVLYFHALKPKCIYRTV